MKNLFSREITLDELVFEHRNHVYGAYAIRKNYSKNMSKALLIAVLFFVALFLSPGIIDSFRHKEVVPANLFEDKIHEFVVTPNLEPVIIHRNSDPKPGRSLNIPKSMTNPMVVKDETVKTDEQLNNTPIDNIKSDESITGGNGSSDSGTSTGVSSGDDRGAENTSNEVFMIVDELPSFGDDHSALTRYLAKSIRYPQIARENHIEGKVVVEFIIGKNGEVNSVNVLRGIGGGCDEEVIRVIHNMPKWKAGIHHGKPVNVKLVLPVSFKLN